MKKIEEISFDDFEKKYLKPEEEFNFTKFKIVCKKCESSNVEFAGKTDVGYGYYGAVDFEHKIIVKCQDCGNAFGMRFEESGSNNYCNCNNE